MSYLYSLALSGNITNNIIYFDLSNANMPGISTIPIDITITTQRPDLVIVNRINSTITILELYVPFETNISDTHNRKLNRYANLIANIESKDFKVNNYALEIGSRGYISPENQNRLKHFIKGLHISNKYSHIKDNICKVAFLASFIIYHSKFEPQWICPSFISFNLQL